MSRPPQRGHPTPDRPSVAQYSGSTPAPYAHPQHEARPLPASMGYERPVITPFAPRIPALGHLERGADPRYMAPVDHTYITQQLPSQALPLRTHQPRIFDTRGYYATHATNEEGPSPSSSHTQDYDRSRAYDMESQ